jgi:hypothetical protein
MHRSNMEDSGGWNRYWYERTGVPQAAQTRRSPSKTVSQVPTLHQCCRPAGALQVVMPSILSHSESPSTAVPAKAGPKQTESRGHFKPGTIGASAPKWGQIWPEKRGQFRPVTPLHNIARSAVTCEFAANHGSDGLVGRLSWSPR